MQRALMRLNLYGREAVRHRRKNSLKTPTMHFLPVFACFWAYVGQPHDHIGWATSMPSHQSILHIQGRIPEIFTKKYWELAKPWKWLLFIFLVFGFWLLGCSKKKLFFLNEKHQGGSYEVAFIFSLWMVSSESWKRLCPN